MKEKNKKKERKELIQLFVFVFFMVGLFFSR